MRFGSLNVPALGIVVASIVVLAAPGAGIGSPGTAISSCGQTVTTNAFLTQDLSCTGDGVIVGAANITIDLRGFTLRGDDGAPDSGIVDNGFDSVKLENGVVRNFGFGIAIDGADKTSVSNVVVSGANIGIYVNGDSASITSSNGIRKRHDRRPGRRRIGLDRVLDGLPKPRVRLDLEGPSASIKSSTAFGNGNDGFFIHGASDSASVASSTATANGISGFEIFGDTVTIKSSVASGNVTRGIFLQGDDANVTGNRTDANGFKTGESDDIGLGINVNGFTTPPRGKNTARGNDNAAECSPLSLC